MEDTNHMSMSERVQYGNSIDNTVVDNSSVFCLINPHELAAVSNGMRAGQQNFAPT